MGMYDREPNFRESFNIGDRMVVTEMRYVGTINTQHGKAEKTIIGAVKRGESRVTRYSALGVGLAQQARRAERSDFPHVAELIEIPLEDDRTVIKFAPVSIGPRDWFEGEDGPPVDMDTVTSGGHSGRSSDIPF